MSQTESQSRELIAFGVGLRSGVLKLCQHHGRVFCDEERDPAAAFVLAQELLNDKAPFLDVFAADPHELMELLTVTIGNAPAHCGDCIPVWGAGARENHPSRGQAA